MAAQSAGHGSTYAVGSDGNAYAWGDNAEGDLGDGTQTYSSTPVRVDLPAGVTAKAVAGGSDNGYAIGSDGNVYAWGWNGQGELGDGTTTGPNLCGSSGTDNCSWSPVRVLVTRRGHGNCPLDCRRTAAGQRVRRWIGR